MAISAIGVIFSNMHEENVPELVRRRTMASIPYGGRYRIIDFALSNMVNSGITKVGLMTSNNYRSLIDHIGSGKDWDLARKEGGIILLPPFSEKHDRLYTTRLEALNSLQGFLNHSNENYVVLMDCDGVAKFDVADIVAYHESKNADITLVTHEREIARKSDFMTVATDEEGRVNEIKLSPHVAKGEKVNTFINVMVVNRQFLLNLVEDSVTHGFTSFEGDVLVKQLNSLKIYAYEFKNYYAGIDSMSAYYKHNMELLNKEVRDELFGDRDIYTKVRDSAPSKYGEDAIVKNSLISDGCEIEGVVENSILFRGVKVEKGSVIRNSIVMQDNIIGQNTTLDCVITDKNVVVSDKKTLGGCSSLPYYIPKGTRL
ncbi:MAG: glucose-1-phosphate adenylyltransferase subunit GlgD [Clostridiales bacterium]|nr:glucose-1-phosphate adenylyltransferase subunit GlgD [Clostridiales bacterium]